MERDQPTAATQAQRYVLADVGATVIALPLDAVVQGLAWPAQMSVLPRRAGALCGVIDFQGEAVAVIDLARWVDLGGAAHERDRYQRLLVLREAGRLVAIAVDAVRGIEVLAAEAVNRIVDGDEPDEVFHSVARCPQAGIASVLDVGRLMALAQVWRGDASAAAGASQVPLAPRARTGAYATMPLAGGTLGFPVSALAEVMPAPELLPFLSATTEGLCMWRGRHVPVTTIDKCFPALARKADKPPRLLALFERDGHALGILLDQVPQIRRFDVPADDGAEVSVIADGEGGLVHLVEPGMLFARFPETALSRQADVDRAASDGAQRNASSHIVYRAGELVSTPIDGVEAVLPLTGPSGEHMAWRGSAIRVVDLRPEASAGGVVIVVSGEGGPVGFIVESVQLLIQARAGKLSRVSLPGHGPVSILTTGEGAAQASYRTCDLAALARQG